MLNKLFSLIVRGGITFGIGLGVGLGLNEGMHTDDGNGVGIVIWIIGGIYSLLKFNQPFNVNVLEQADDKIDNIIDEQSKKKI